MLPPYIHEVARLENVPPAGMDILWARGWRHFGADFFRYSLMPGETGEILTIQPLRIPLADFCPGKSQRRILKRNADLSLRIVPAMVDAEREDLFFRHRERFTSNVPDSLRDFMASAKPDCEPCECVSVEARLEGRLIATSYLDVGQDAVSSVYAMFDPLESRRGLGTLTLLEEIRWARDAGKTWLYPGYATQESSVYDYKKAFQPLEFFDWSGNWRALE